jgi:hypothetical protein
MKNNPRLHSVLFLAISLISLLLLSCEVQDEEKATASWQTVFEDSFNRTAANLGTNWTTDITTSTLTTNGSDALFNYVNSPGFTSVYNNSISDNHIRITLTFQISNLTTTGHVSIIARSNVEPNGLNGDYYNFYVDTTKIGLARITGNNAFTAIGLSSSYTISASTTYKLVFELNGSSLTGSLYNSSDTLLASVTTTDTNYTSGYAGINGTWNTTVDPDVTFTDFKIEKYQ